MMEKEQPDFGQARIIHCSGIDISPKDIIRIKYLKDFNYLCSGSTIFKCENEYWLLSDSVAYIYNHYGNKHISSK